jgi:hypothetical protein
VPTNATPLGKDPEPVADKWRGTAEYVLDDGRRITREIIANTAGEWADKMADAVADVEAWFAKKDAEEGVEKDEPITENKTATKLDRAAAKIRAAARQEDPYTAYKMFTRFNEYRLAQGYTVPQVRAALATVGMTAEEFDKYIGWYQTILNVPDAIAAWQVVESYAQAWRERDFGVL